MGSPGWTGPPLSSRPQTGLAVLVATAIAAVGAWFALLTAGTGTTIGFFVFAIAVVLSMLALAGFGGAADPIRSGLRGATLALGFGAFLAVVWAVSGADVFGLLLPAGVLGLGGITTLPPLGEPGRLAARVIVVGAGALIAVLVGLVDVTVWALVAPLLPLPSVAIGDKLFRRSESG